MKGFNGKELPCIECGGLCCKYAPIETKVWERVKHKAEGAEITLHWAGEPKEAYIAIKPGSDGVCWFLQDGRCAIYTYRPPSCRGVGTRIPCAYVDPKATMQYVLAARASGHKFVADGG